MQKGNLVVIVWQDSSLLNLLTNCYEGYRTRNQRVVRYLKCPTSLRKIAYNIPAPEVVETYNKFMGGVDRAIKPAKIVLHSPATNPQVVEVHCKECFT